MPSLSGPPSSYFIFNMNALPHNGPVVPHPQAAARPHRNLPVQKGPPRVQASLSTFVSTCKILWETGAVDSRVSCHSSPKLLLAIQGRFPRAPGTTHRVAGCPPSPTCQDHSGSTQGCVLAGEGLPVPSTRLWHPPFSLCHSSRKKLVLCTYNRDAAGHKKEMPVGQTKLISSYVYRPGGGACPCGQKHFLRTYYSSGKNDSWLLLNCSWKSLILGVGKDSLTQDFLLTPGLSAWSVDQQSQHLQETVRNADSLPVLLNQNLYFHEIPRSSEWRRPSPKTTGERTF